MPVPLLLTAPTAAGKTALALEFARRLQDKGQTVEIVAADAFTVYRGLDIGTAKPSVAERQQVRHHLIDVADVRQNFDVAQFVAQAEQCVAQIMQRDHVALVVGGTGFYLAALLGGLPLTPAADPKRRAALEAELQERGLQALLDEIQQHSPAEAERMQRNPRRIVRALEVFRWYGRWPSEFGYAKPRFTYRSFGFGWPAEVLEQRIEERTEHMLAQGWPQEAAWLAEQVSPDALPRPTAWQALGYWQALAVARQELSLPEAKASITLATRQYTKRQLTWMKAQSQTHGLQWLAPHEVVEQLLLACKEPPM